MKYIVRLNPRSYNPLTNKVDKRIVWEVEQAENKDSKKVIWHCADVKVRRGQTETPIRFEIAREYANAPNLQKEKPVELSYWGIVVRGSDDSIVIVEGRADVGN